MDIQKVISSAVLKAVKELNGADVPEKMVQLQNTKEGFEGNLTVVVFPFLKTSRKKPEDTAQEIGQWLLQNCEAISNFNVVKGFLNLVIAPAAWISLLNDINTNEHLSWDNATTSGNKKGDNFISKNVEKEKY